MTVMQLFKANGYETCAVGRLDMVTSDSWHDPAQIARAVDRFLGSASNSPGNYYREVKGTEYRSYPKGTPWFKDGKRWPRPEGPYSTDLISDFVAEYIQGTKGSNKPFCIYVSHYAPHWPLQAAEKEVEPYLAFYRQKDRKDLMEKRLERLVAAGLIPEGTQLHKSMIEARPAAGGYLALERMALHAAMIESIDQTMASTLDALKKADKLDNTLILVLSDNGASHQMAFDNQKKLPQGVRPGSKDTFLNHGPALAASSNVPFKGYKVSNYEGGIASPLIAWWPKGIHKKGSITKHPTHIADIVPTCLELAGADYPEEFEGRTIIPLDGKSFASALQDPEGAIDANRTLVWPKAIREGDWKLVLERKGNPELYNLAQDRNEMKNLASQYPGKVKAMRQHHLKLFTR